MSFGQNAGMAILVPLRNRNAGASANNMTQHIKKNYIHYAFFYKIFSKKDLYHYKAGLTENKLA